MEEELVIDYEYFDDLNKDGPCIIYNDKKSALLGKKCYSVKKFEQIEPNMEVKLAYFDSCVCNNDSFYWSVPCLRKPKLNKQYKDGTIVSARWKIDGRSYRKGFNGGNFVVPMFDVCIDGRPVCLRFYENRVHIAGKIAKTSFNKICDIAKHIIEDARWFWDFCQANKDLLIEATVWFSEFAKSKRNEVRLIDCDDVECTDYKMLWPAFAPAMYSEIITEITNRYSDILYVSQLMERTMNILNSDPPSAKECNFNVLCTSHVRCTYKLGFNIDIDELVKGLEECGYNVMNYDVTGPKVKVTIINNEEYDDDNLIVRKKTPFAFAQKLQFSSKGTIQHSGTGHTRHKETYNNLMRDMILLFG